MITSTVLHAGFINEAMAQAMTSERYHLLAAQVNDFMLPFETRQAALEALHLYRLEVWAQAGRKYRLALQAYEFHRMMGRPGTAIEYQEPPREPILIDFTYPA